ncbi:ABC transporter permease [Pseudogemmobacter sonorensis]|uniref:ABC transporter permease n=1 Tax=Pseudogemmobacter sonorensis TaxID=2989681 RepID=UPI003696E34E
MLNYALRRMALALLVALTVSVIGFFLIRLSGDLARTLAGPNATAEQIANISRAYGLDRPLVVQFLDWLFKFLGGDFGQSFYFRSPVADLVIARLPNTLILGVSALAVALLVAVPLGMAAAARQGGWTDRFAQLVAALGQSMPNFWVALLLMMFLGLELGLLPISGSRSVSAFVMPVLALAFAAQPALLRLTRAGMIEVLEADYMRTARAKSLSPAKLLFKHALRNAVLPVVSVSAVQLGHLIGGSVVIESIFAIEGIGYLAWESILRTDFPVVQAILVVIAFFYVLLSLGADLLNALLDPRIRGN